MAAQTPRPMPSSVEMERSILGAALSQEGVVGDIDGLEPEDFWRDDHQELWRLMLTMDAEGKPINIVTVPEYIQAEGEPEKYGGYGYVVELPDHCVSVSNVDYYVGRVKDMALRRRLIENVQGAEQSFYDGDNDATDLVDDLVGKISGDVSRSEGHGLRPLAEVAEGRVVELDEYASTPEAERHSLGLSTGFRDLDYRTGGMRAGDLIVLASRPSMGKSALAMNIALRAARRDEGPVAAFQLEMSGEQLTDRVLADMASINATALRKGRLQPADVESLYQAQRRLAEMPLFLDDRPGQTMASIRARARRLKDRFGSLALVLIDYLQLVTPASYRVAREQQVARMARDGKLMAKDLGVPVLLLAQLSRAVEQRPGKRPQMSDLRESGAIEQDADQVWFLVRFERYFPDEAKHKDAALVIVDKNRNGTTGDVDLKWHGGYQRFRDLSPQEAARGGKEEK